MNGQLRFARPILAALLAVMAAAVPVSPVAAANPVAHFTLTGAAAAGFSVPGDVELVSTWHDLSFNLDYARYQQYTSPGHVFVQGGELTVVTQAATKVIVAGAYYPSIPAAGRPTITPTAALSLATQLSGGLDELPQPIAAAAQRRIQLRLDPVTGKLFFLVATGALGYSRYQTVDAQTGRLIRTWSSIDQIAPGHGLGVKGDNKKLSPSSFPGIGKLTSPKVGGGYQLVSDDVAGTFLTYNAANGTTVPTSPMTGVNDIWDSSTQAAAVDAQYYAAFTLTFYRQTFGYDMISDCPGIPAWPGKLRSVVHYRNSYDNAFWDDQSYYMVYGDGSSSDLPLSAGQDVVSHELTHGITQCRGDLNYQDESGALNEAFSDIMATSAEWSMPELTSSHCRLKAGQTECPDWFIGEDIARTSPGAVIRDFADPQSEKQPSHYADRVYVGTNIDNGGVHYNSGIVNHAYYLMVNGGRNARCSGPLDPKANCDVFVPPTTLDHAQHIFFNGFAVLSNLATMCDARNATIATAAVLYPNSVTDIAATILAWLSVGLGANCDGSTDFKVSLSDPTLELAPGSVGATSLSLNRINNSTRIDYGTITVGPAVVDASPVANLNGDSTGTTITVTANNSAVDGVYPILITATGGGQSHYLAASFVMDATPPTAAVTGVGFLAGSAVQTDGTIPLDVTWTATDSESGIASKELDQSPNGSGWVSIGTTTPTSYSTTAGPHQFQVVATDTVGNDATSAAFTRTLTEFQETAATYTYPASWKVNNTGTPWGTTKYSTKRLASATLTFTGKAVVWIAQRGPKRGVANVFVDGVKTHVDLYSSFLSERRVVFIASNLSAGQHTIRIKVKATSHRPRVDVDGFFVLN